MGDARAKMEAKARFLSRMDLEGGEATTSMRTTGDMTTSMRSTEESFDLDFGVTESGRTIAHLVVDHGQDDSDMDFSITSSGRTVEHFPPDVSAPDSMLDITHSLRSTKSEYFPNQERSPARPIPTSDETTLSQQGPTSSQPSSHGSSGSAFLNGLLNGETSLTTSGLSHTPPVASSYELSHFGKRARSGSVSGRLRSASDLEEKGVIDRQQKAVLKDLIICGDEELHQALDLYEAGHTSQLESMIQTGALSDKAVPDLDLLGDLDLDFLSVNDHGMGGESADMYNLQQQDSQPLHETAVASMLASKLPQRHSTSEQGKRGVSMVSPEYEATGDGIGELEFNTDYADNAGSFLGDPQYTTGINHRPEVSLPGPGERSRANSMFSEADASGRMRSNSLFSALLNEGAKAHNQEIQFGRWMDRYPSRNQQIAARSRTDRIEESEDEDEDEEEEEMQAAQEAARPTKKKGGIGASLERHKRKNESKARSESKAKAKQLLKEEKARLRQEKREAKEREKQKKKEERLQARLEKKKAIEEEKEREEHIPGSGKPHAMNDPLLKSSLDDNGLLNVDRPDGWIGAYSPESRKLRIEKFLEKRNQRVWTKTVKYDVRKNFADSRLRVKGRFVKKEDELLMRELMSLT